MSTLCVIIMMFCYDLDEQKIKQIPHNVGRSLTDDFQPSAACKFLDLPPGTCQPVRRGSADPSSLKTVHWTVFRALVPLKSVHWTDFRALEPSKPAKFAGHAWLKFTSSYHHPIMRYFLKAEQRKERYADLCRR